MKSVRQLLEEYARIEWRISTMAATDNLSVQRAIREQREIEHELERRINGGHFAK